MQLTRIRLRRLKRGEAGFAVPAAIAVLMVILLLGVAATRVALSANDTAKRDFQSKRALQAADTGMRMALYQHNSLGVDLRTLLNLSQECVAKVDLNVTTPLASVALAAGATWCPPVSEDMGNGVTWAYQVSSVATVNPQNLGTVNAQAILSRKVVAVGTACRTAVASCVPGTAGSVSRRITSTLQAGVPSSITSNVLSVFGLLTGTVVTKLQLYTQGANSFHECSPGKPPSTTVFHTSGCGDP